MTYYSSPCVIRTYLLLILAYSGVACFVHAQNPEPILSVQNAGDSQIRVVWSDEAAGYLLEESLTLGAFSDWQSLSQATLEAAGELVIRLEIGDEARFFRLHLTDPPLVTLNNASPLNGESGVSVTRETIIHFSAPLSSDTTLDQDMFYAEFGGRKILSRAELSSDGMKATLFYLEPLPGSSRVAVTFDGTGVKDRAGAFMDADGDGIPGGQAVIAFDTLSLSPLEGTAVVGQVFASELAPAAEGGAPVDKPLAGVTITVDGLEETLRTVTDSTGSFTLTTVPPGRFFVHIDGRTVVDAAAGIRYPDLAYYPFVGKAWDAVAGVMDNPAGGTGTIYLPLITVGTLQEVSLTEDTIIEFPPDVVAANPDLAGVSITVPANSLFGNDGTRGGMVGIAPVSPERLPGPLPPGMEMPLIVTVQTNGPLNFDRPAPVCFPNLPNPVLGVPLPAGSKQSLISFNHKKGVWEAVGSMTVSADGKTICTDPGVGIIQPGWHGVAPPPVSPPPPSKPPKCDFRDFEDDRFEGCLGTCSDEALTCKIKAVAAWDADFKSCDKIKDPFEASDCKIKVYGLYFQYSDHCNFNYEACTIRCSLRFSCLLAPSDVGSGNVKHSQISLMNSTPTAGMLSVFEEIDAIFQQINFLAAPYVATRSPIPAETENEIASLRMVADEIAGGDVGEFLRMEVIQQEDQLAETTRALGFESYDLIPGNAPNYPVLYAAKIERSDELVTLRGATEPLGQYTLFVPPDGTLLNVSFYDPQTGEFGIITPNLNPNTRYALPRFNLLPLASDVLDYDQDGLPDIVEEVYGTDDTNADTDGDGIPDGAEIEQGTDPLGGLVAQTGVVATVRTPGAAIDIATGNGLAVLAQGASGMSVVDISKISQPTIIAQVDTPGTAQRVAFSGNLVAVADGPAGLAVIDVANPVTARIIQQIHLPGAQSVAVGAGIGYVGTSPGLVFSVDLLTGTVLNQVSVTDPVMDLFLEGDHLYALTRNRLHVIDPFDGVFSVVGSTASPFVAAQNQRLFVGGGIAYTVHNKGYNTLDVTNPALPVLLTAANTAQFGWRQVAANGSGLGLAAVGPNLSDDGTHDVSLYDLSDPQMNDVFVTTFPTPGNGRAVSIFNGLAYVADDAAGMQVVNYLPYDANGVPPTIALTSSFPEDGVEEGKPVRVSALVGDDVQVRNVEFYIDGVKALTDGAFPFEFRFIPPSLTVDRESFTLRARAVDTGGNFTWTEERTVMLWPDITPPRFLQHTPVGGGKTLRTLTAFLDGPVDETSLNTGSFLLFSAGDDGMADTADDVPVTGGSVTYREESRAATLSFATPLPDGIYRAVLTTEVADFAGNGIESDYSWQFRVADAVFWIRTTDGLWSDPLNWNTGALPGPEDNVIIELDSVEVTVTHGIGTTAVKSLVSRERLIVNSNGLLEIPGGILSNKHITLDRGTIKGGTVTFSEGAKLIIVNNIPSTLDGVTLHGDLDVTSTLARVIIRNGLTIDGSVLLDRGGIINFVGNQTFATGGIVFGGILGGGGIWPNTLSVDTNTTLTLGPDVVVRGKLGAMNGTGTLINQGLISADVAGGTLSIDARGFTNTGTSECRNGGSLTLSATTWNNTGVINAEGTGALTLMDAWSNTGILNASGATVNLSGTFTQAQLGTLNRTGGTVKVTGVLDLTDDTLALNATTGSLTLDRGTIKGGTVTLNEGAKLIIVNNIPSTLDGVTLNGDLDVTSSGARVFIRNGLTLNGSVLLDRGGNITFIGTQSLDSGSIVFGGLTGGTFPNTLTIQDNNTSLTLGPAVVMRGKLASVNGNGTLINEGLISADVAGGTLSIDAKGFTNAGTSECRNGGSLTISATTWNNTGVINGEGAGALTLMDAWSNTGTINAGAGTVNLGGTGGTFTLAQLGTLNRTGGTLKLTGTLDLTGDALTLNATTGSWTLDRGTIRGGTVTLSEGAKLIIENNIPSTLDGVTLNGDLDVTSTLARVIIRNGLTLNGSLLVDRGGIINFAGNQTFATGSIVFGGILGGGSWPNSFTIDNNTTLTLGPAVVVRGKQATINGNGTLINEGLISADVAGGTLSIDVKGFTNAGTSECRNGGSLTLSAATWNNTEVINAEGAGALTLMDAWSNTGTINAGTATVNLGGIGGTFTLAQLGTLNRTGGTVKVTGVLDLTGDTLELNATTGSWTLDRGTIRGGTVTLSEEAKLIIVNNIASTLDSATLNGNLDVTGARVLIRNGLTLNGSVLLDLGGNITFEGNQTLVTGSIIFNNGSPGFNDPNTITISANTTLTLGPAVVVRGKLGTVNGTGTLINQGLISADVAGGTITIDPGQFINNGTVEEKNGGKIVIVP
jgi:hypothetical protein